MPLRINGPLRNNLDTTILASLNRQPLTSYRCCQVLSKELGQFVSQATMYAHFCKMDRLGIIERNVDGFVLTVKGEKMLKQHLTELQFLASKLQPNKKEG
jgi:DNA-binding PadR family transcriptional regulator